MLFSVTAALLLATSPAQDGASTSQQPAESTQAAADKKICRRLVATGSIQPRRICHTRSEWAAIDGGNEENFLNARRRMQGNFPSAQE